MPKKVIDPNLSIVQDEVYFQFRNRQYEAMNQNVREGILHVSDYVNDCMRNVFYGHMKAIPFSSMDTTSMSILFAGEAVHRMVDSVQKDETKMAWDMVQDCKPNKKSKPLDILWGECDAIYMVESDDGKIPVIVDYKTWLSNGWKMKGPKDTHVKQINFYKYLARKCLGIDVKYGSVIYLDFAERLQKPQVFTFELDTYDEIIGELESKRDELVKASDTGVLPPRFKSWKCDGYCPHAERCFSEEKISKEELAEGLK